MRYRRLQTSVSPFLSKPSLRTLSVIDVKRWGGSLWLQSNLSLQDGWVILGGGKLLVLDKDYSERGEL